MSSNPFVEKDIETVTKFITAFMNFSKFLLKPSGAKNKFLVFLRQHRNRKIFLND